MRETNRNKNQRNIKERKNKREKEVLGQKGEEENVRKKEPQREQVFHNRVRENKRE